MWRSSNPGSWVATEAGLPMWSCWSIGSGVSVRSATGGLTWTCTDLSGGWAELAWEGWVDLVWSEGALELAQEAGAELLSALDFRHDSTAVVGSAIAIRNCLAWDFMVEVTCVGVFFSVPGSTNRQRSLNADKTPPPSGFSAAKITVLTYPVFCRRSFNAAFGVGLVACWALIYRK